MYIVYIVKVLSINLPLQGLFLLQESLLLLVGVERRHNSMDQKGNRQPIANRRYYIACFVSRQCSLRENVHK